MDDTKAHLNRSKKSANQKDATSSLFTLQDEYAAEFKTPLHAAAEIGNLEAVEFFLNMGSNINAQLASGETPLSLACKNNRVETVSFLLSNNADPNLKVTRKNDFPDVGGTLLHVAVALRFLRIVRLLCQSGADVNAKTCENETTPLHLACGLIPHKHIKHLMTFNPNREELESGNLEVTKVLCEYGANINAQDWEDKTPLHYATAEANLEILGYVLSVKANPNIKNLGGEIVLHFASQNGRFKAVELLFESGAYVNAQNFNGFTSLHHASIHGHAEIANYLLHKNANPDLKNKFGETPAHLAARNGHLKVIEVLIQGRCNINAQTNDGLTAFDLAWKNSHIHVTDYLQKFIASKIGGFDTKVNYLARVGEWSKIVELLSSSDTTSIVQTKNLQLLFHLACQSGRVEVVRLLLVKHLYSDFVVEYRSKTPLHVAAEEGHVQIMELLCKHGAKVNGLGSNGVTPLFLACMQGKMDSVKYLLNNHADPNIPCDYLMPQTALYPAVHSENLELVELLVKYGADLDVQDSCGRTPLHFVCKFKKTCIHNSLVTIKWLLNNKANVNAVTSKNKTPLHFAANCESPEVAELLIREGANVNAVDNLGRSPIFFASKSYSCHYMLQFLLGKNADPNIKSLDGQTILHIIIAKGKIEVLELLILNGADVNAQTAVGLTPLCLASSIEDPNKNAESVGYLLCNGADPNIRGPESKTALHFAVESACFESVKLLVERGVDINAQTEDSSTPLHFALENLHEQIVEYLLLNNADPNICRNSNATPLHIAANRGFLTLVQLLLNNHASINAQTENGSTSLHLATENGFANVVGYLLRNNADPNIETNSARTPLHLAVEKGFSIVVEMLLKNHTEVNVVDFDGFFPLQRAALRGDVETVKLLVEFDANIDAQSDTRKYTAFQYAATKGYDEVVQVLLESGFDINTKGFRDALNSRHSQIAQLCQRHIIKLKAAKLCDVEQFEEEIKFKNPNLDNLPRNCETEVKKMCGVRLTLPTDGETIENFSPYDILVNRNNPAFVKSDNIVQALEKIDFSAFPIYKSFILNTFRRNKRKNELLELGHEALSVIMKTAKVLNSELRILPFDIFEHITSYLGAEDLKSLIRCSRNLKFQLTRG